MTLKPNFRWRAREALERAKSEIASNDDIRLRYGALELREALEALVYDKALAIEEYLPPELHETWQPRKVLSALLDIDPTLQMKSSVSFGLEETPGVPPPSEKMTHLGSEQPITLSDLREHYDALGSYLHTPTISQLRINSTIDYSRLRERCIQLITTIDSILASSVFNVTLGLVATLNKCENDACNLPVRKRIPPGVSKLDAKCFGCGMEYVIEAQGNNQTLWRPQKVEVACAHSDCGQKATLMRHDIKPGAHWTCKACKRKNKLALGVVPA